MRRYVQDYDEKNPATYKGLNLHTMPMSALYAHFGLDAQTIDFIGHALALHRCGRQGRQGMSSPNNHSMSAVPRVASGTHRHCS
jgi:RAB protein geranylgeranyltransferase component A